MNEIIENSVNVKLIMEDIKREIREKGLANDLPAFNQVAVLRYEPTSPMDLTGLRQNADAARANCTISAEFPVTGSKLLRLFKRASQKATRCSTMPMVLQISEANLSIMQCMDSAIAVINQQQNQIMEMDKKIEQLEKALNQGVSK